MSSKYLNESGLSYFWTKLKAYFAPKAHTHNAFETKHSYTVAANAAKNWYRIANANTSQMDTTKPIHAQFILTAYNASYGAGYYERWFVIANVFGRTAHISILGIAGAPFSQVRVLYENTITDLDTNDRPAIDIYLNYQLANGTTKIEIEEVYNSGWTFLADGQLAASTVPTGFENQTCSARGNGVAYATNCDYSTFASLQRSNFTSNFTLADDNTYRARVLNCTGTITVTVPSINSVWSWFIIKNFNTTSGVITIHPSTTSVLIDGSNANITLQPGEYIMIHSKAANAYTIVFDGRWKSQKANASHNQASNTITAMTGYSKPSSASAIGTGDTLNDAIGKLEFKVDSVDVSNYLPITGGTVTGTITASSGAAFKQYHSSYIKGNSYSSNVYLGQGWYDKNGTVLADLLYYLNTPANGGDAWVGFRLWGNPNYSSSTEVYFGITSTSSGETYASCPTPSSASDNSNKIATTAWVKNAAVAKTGDTMTGTLTISNTAPLYHLRNTNITKGTVPSAYQWSQIIFFGNTGSSVNDRMGFIEQETRSDGWNILRLASCKNIANTFDYAWLTVEAPNDSAKRGYVSCCGFYKDQALVNNAFSLGTNPSSTEWWSFTNCCRDEWLSGMWAWVSSTGQSQIEFRVRGNSASLSHKTFWIFQNLNGSSAAGTSAETLRPTLNTFSTLGIAGTGRWGQIYSTSSTINTSDERQKCDIEAIPDEILDAWETCEFYQYRMKDSIGKKGENARYHTGMIAQRLDKKFKDANENLNKYGLFCYDEWEAIEARKDDKDNIIEPAVEAGNEYSIRYEEALCMEAAYQRRENARLKKRVADLEDRLAALELRLGSE